MMQAIQSSILDLLTLTGMVTWAYLAVRFIGAMSRLTRKPKRNWR